MVPGHAGLEQKDLRCLRGKTVLILGLFFTWPGALKRDMVFDQRHAANKAFLTDSIRDI